MAEPKKYTEDEAYGMLQTALLTGQDALDSLPDDVKKMALGAAERSLAPGRGGYDLTNEELESPDREGFTPVVEPPSEEVDRKGYDLTKEELASPDREGSTPVPGIEPPKEPGPSKEFLSREEYKGFRAPKGMTDQQTSAWKSAIDDSVLEQGAYNAEQARFEAGRQQFFEASDSKAADALGSLFAMGAAASAGTGIEPVYKALFEASDDALTGSAEAVAQKSKMSAMGKVGRDTKAFNKADKALDLVTPGRGVDWLKGADEIVNSAAREMRPGKIYIDMATVEGGDYRKSPGLDKLKVFDPVSGKDTSARKSIKSVVNLEMVRDILQMPKISSNEVKAAIKAATEAKNIAATTLEASKSAYKDVAARASSLQDANITTGLKLFSAKAAGKAAIAMSPLVGAAVSSLGIPIIAMSELAKHGKIDDMLQTMSYRMLERPVAYGDVGDTVHSYLIQNPSEAEELFSKGVIDGDYYEWVAESVGTSPDVILDTLAQ